MKRISVSIVILLAILVLVSACQTPAGRSTGQVVDDATITSEVKAKLLADSITKGIAVSVETFEGQVTLTGAVDSENQRERAVQIAKSVKGVKKVNNLINLKK
jgi:hyperosmotically inducible periplasmic protein